MVAKRHRSSWKISAIVALLMFSPHTEVPPPTLPGNENQPAPTERCPIDNKPLVSAEDGTLECRECGYVREAPAKPG